MYTYPLDQSVLPKVVFVWNTTKGWQHLKAETGEKIMQDYVVGGHTRRWQSYDNTNNTMIYRPKKYVYNTYMKYHEDTELLEIAQVKMSGSRKEVSRIWEYAGDRYFISRDKTVRNINGDIQTVNFRLNEIETYYSFIWFLRKCLRYCPRTNEFKKLLKSDYYVTGHGTTYLVNYSWSIINWFKTSTPHKPKTKAQKLLDELAKIELQSVEFTEDQINEIYNHATRTYYCYRNVAYFQKLNDDWCVIRIAKHHDDKLTETNRIYISDKNLIAAVKVNDQWRSCSKWNYSYDSPMFVNKAEAIEKCKRIKYIAENDPNISYNQIICSLRFPALEQLSKIGGNDAVKKISNQNNIKSELKRYFGGIYNDKETTLAKKVGLSKKQLKFIVDGTHNNYYVLRKMRQIYGDDLSPMDYESFKSNYAHCENVNRYFYSDYHINGVLITDAKFYKNLKRLGQINVQAYQLARDTLNQYHWLNATNRPEINWCFDSMSDLVRAHDAVVALVTTQREEQQRLYRLHDAERRKAEQEKMEKIDKERKQYEYEDDNFIIRLPKTVAEIVTEGSKQRICIGGYTTYHALGRTTLFFLRKKSDPDSPFYAIEMDTQKNIRQIHGYCNKWLGCNPEAIPTVVRWLRKNNIKCDEKILTCAATGYHATNHCIAMPTVD